MEASLQATANKSASMQWFVFLMQVFTKGERSYVQRNA